MNENLEILLGSTENVNSVNVNNYQKIEITNKLTEILEYDIRNALSATDVFDAEREANDVYRIYGRIEYLSLLNGLKLKYTKIKDFFLPTGNSVNIFSPTGNCKNIFNSFIFYLLKAASSGYTSIIGSSIDYTRYFEVIATPKDFELYNAGFANNVYGDQTYAFNFNKNISVETYVDNFNFPATELFLFAQYIPNLTQPQVETLSGTSWGTDGIPVKVNIIPTTLNIGDKVYGDLIEYSKSDFLQFQLEPQTYYIETPYVDDFNNSYSLQWKYNPFIPLRLKYFYDTLNEVNTGTTSYAQSSRIPYYATPIGNGNYVWRDILPQGFIDPLTNLGVDYPFVNKKRYLFASIILDVSPDISDANSNTFKVFTEIKFGPPEILSINPINQLDNIGKPCQ